ncbi:uncharacterized protein TNCV_4287051 [Trichonephila clavipes]|nr:uncharacterized protein TNCV_4287051 [Trichonephila clavipes]
MSILEKLAKISKMEVDPSDKNQSPCFQRHQILKKIEIEKMTLKTFKELHQKYHNSDPSLAETTIDAADEHQLKLDALVSERDSLPECQTFNCQFCPKSIHTTPVIVNTPVNNNNVVTQDKIDNSASKTTLKSNSNKINNNKNKKFNKRKLKKDSMEDFVFPTKTARPASPSISEPVATTNSFSNLEEDKNQEVEEEANIAVVPKPRPPQPIHLKITENFRNQMKLIYQNFPDITSKNSGKFIKLFTKDVEEKRSLTHYLESDKDFEYFCIKPKLEKPIKVVIKGLPIFTKTLEIHSDLEEEGFTVEKSLN